MSTAQPDELELLKSITESFAKLPDEAAQQRVLNYVCDKFGLSIQTKKPPKTAGASQSGSDEEDDDDESGAGDNGGAAASKFTSIAKLFEAAAPAQGTERALVAGYWFQVCQSRDEFKAKEVNDALKKLGHPLSNVTKTFTGLADKSPKLVMQSGKLGSRKKLLALTEAGISAVEKMFKKTAE